MNLRKWKKAVLGIVAMLLIGAVGSGLWDVGVKPVGQWTGKAILDVATLGSAAVKDGTYREAAKGLHEAAALQMFTILLGALVTLPFVVAAGTVRLRAKAAQALRSTPEEQGHNLAPARESSLALQKKVRLYFRALYTLELILFLLIGSVFIQSLKIMQANEAYTLFSQSMAICRPYIEEREAQMLASRFAGIQRRADYIEIVDELRRIATSKQRQLPDFQPW